MKVYFDIEKWIKLRYPLDEQISGDPIDLEYKILIVGDKLVGKTSICMRFCVNEFNLEIKPSTQTECFTKNVKIFDKSIILYLIDVDSSSLKDLKSYIYSDVKAVIAVYDITKPKTFENIELWVNEIKKKVNNDIPILLIGNKSDLKFLRNVDFEEASEKANILGCEIRECSCIDTTSIKDAMKYIVAKIYYLDLPENQKLDYKKLVINKDKEIKKEEVKKEEVKKEEKIKEKK